MKEKKVTQPKVAMVILTYNQKKLLEETLESIIKKTNYKNYKIFLVDNGSIDRHDLMVKKRFPKVEVIRNTKNLGYSKGNNIGIREAQETYNPDYFVLLNDDIEMIDGEWLNKMIKVAESDEKIGIVGCQSIYPDGSFQNAGGYLRRWELTKILEFNQGEILDVDHFDVVCMLVKREVMNKVEGMDESYTPFLLEDSDFSLRTKEEGYLIKVHTDVKVVHKKSQTIDSMDGRLNLLIRFKNDIIFSRRHLKGWDRFFRMFIFLPTVAMLKKKNDNDELKLRNFRIRKDFLRNIYYYLSSFNRNLYKAILLRGGIEV